MLIRTFRLSYRAIFFTFLTIGLLPVYLICRAWAKPRHRDIARLWHRGIVRLIGLKVKTQGTVATDGPVLYVANHVSYLDIPILASQFNTTFVAKAEVRRWPLFGYLAHIADTVFIERRTARAPEQMRDLRSQLIRGEKIVLFPEGTSTNGLAVESFKPVLLQSALPIRRQMENPPKAVPVTVQPISIAFRPNKIRQKRLPGDHAWFGEMTLLPHLLEVFRLKGGEVEITFLEPVIAADIGCRKALAALTEKAVAQALEESILAFDKIEPALQEPTLFSLDGIMPVQDAANDAAVLVAADAPATLPRQAV